jgi:hypothetical protein
VSHLPRHPVQGKGPGKKFLIHSCEIPPGQYDGDITRWRFCRLGPSGSGGDRWGPPGSGDPRRAGDCPAALSLAWARPKAAPNPSVSALTKNRQAPQGDAGRDYGRSKLWNSSDASATPRQVSGPVQGFGSGAARAVDPGKEPASEKPPKKKELAGKR